MKFLRENYDWYDGLRKIRKLPQDLKDFVSKPRVKTAFESSNFSDLYKYSKRPDSEIHPGQLTILLNSLNINPLNYLDYIPDGFLSNSSIKSMNIPNDIKSIGDLAFWKCVSLTTVTIGSSVVSIGKYAFEGCSSLTSITIPDSVIDIGNFAFWKCTGLAVINIGKNTTNIGNGAFRGCNKLKEINYNGTKSNWDSINKGENWDFTSPISTIHCTDGDIEL